MLSLGNADSLHLFGPELALSLGAVGLFLVDLVLWGKGRAKNLTGVALALLGLTFVLLWREPPGDTLLFGGLVAHDGLRSYFGILFLAAASITTFVAHESPQIEEPRAGEFLGLLLTVTLGMFVLASATDLLVLYLALEAISLPSYVLAGLKRHDKKSSEAALKYVLYGGVASAVMLYGLSLLYGLFGTTRLAGPGSIGDQLMHGLAQGALAGAAHDPALKLALALALVFVLAGLAFKVSAAPFHQWAPDVYEGAPTPFTLFLSIGPKLAGFALAVRLLLPLLSLPAEPFGLDWSALVGILAFATMTVGNLGAFGQTNLKRLLAWSSVGHAGYLLLGLAAANGSGMRALLVYAAVYLVLNAGAFTVVDVLSRSVGEEIADVHGLAKRSPFLAGMFAVFLFGLAGLPPLAGFSGKVLLFASLVERGGWAIGLALSGLLYSALSLYVYAQVLRELYFQEPAEPSRVPVGPGARGLLVGLAGLSLVFGVWWSPLATWASVALAR